MIGGPQHWHVGLIGYGEVGRILAEDLRARDLAVSAFDLKLGQPEHAAELRAHAQAHGVRLVDSAVELASTPHLIISAVTAGQTLAAAESCVATLRQGCYFLDFNSASPQVKQQAAVRVDGAGGCYVEGAVMTSVPPYRIRVPLLLGGPHAAELCPHINALGFEARVVSERLGVASATKMCRSVMIKGLEAMVIESLTAARHYGVEDAVVGSLLETFPGIDWERQASYFFQRVIEHGRRRSEELSQAAITVRDAGLTPWSATGTTMRQAWMADLADAGCFGPLGTPEFARSANWRQEADRLLAHLNPGSAPLGGSGDVLTEREAPNAKTHHG